jgi:hypothetical protein
MISLKKGMNQGRLLTNSLLRSSDKLKIVRFNLPESNDNS